MRYSCFLQTGQKTCHDAAGLIIPGAGSGQDAEFAAGLPWPEPRFRIIGNSDKGGASRVARGAQEACIVKDLLTGLIWTLDANPAEFPLDWPAALDFVARMNEKGAHGFSDWRLPDRRELRSLISHQTRNPALPEGHPFRNVYLGWYWTSSTAARNPDYAWYVHMEGGRVFYGAKDHYYLVWPIRGAGNGALCDARWDSVSSSGAGQEARFDTAERVVLDRRTNLRWMRTADLLGSPCLWEEALAAVRDLNLAQHGEHEEWRLPNVNELESLVDLERHDPALPAGHPFTDVRDVYWSSTTSMFEPDWAWALYLDKGAVGVGRKNFARFHVWAVSDGTSMSS